MYDRVTRSLSAVTDAAGVDRGWGSAAYGAFVATGFVDVTAQLYARSMPIGTAGHDLLATYVRQLRVPILATGLASETDLDAFLELTADPGLRAVDADHGEHLGAAAVGSGLGWDWTLEDAALVGGGDR